jgi:hypothetical protein
MVKPHTEVSKPFCRIPLFFTETHTEENLISSEELVFSPYLMAGHGGTKFLNIMTLIKFHILQTVHRN